MDGMGVKTESGWYHKVQTAKLVFGQRSIVGHRNGFTGAGVATATGKCDTSLLVSRDQRR